jgi:hypothetical protein
MKRLFALTLISLLLVSFIMPSSALEISPCFNNTLMTQTDFIIESGGNATVCIDYTGYSGITTGANITSTIQKRVALFFWSDVTSWSDTSSEYSYSNEHSYQLSSTGTYRAVVQYTVYGTGGSPDIINETIERTYN